MNHEHWQNYCPIDFEELQNILDFSYKSNNKIHMISKGVE